MRPARFFLIGPPAAGKSTLGRRWAKRLQLPLYDTDDEIVQRTGKSITEWFSEGERCFRAIEYQIIHTLLTETERGIFVVGGGFPAQPGAMTLLRTSGYVIWVDPPMAWLRQRLLHAAENRPLLRARPEAEQLALIESRRPFYREADLHWRPNLIPENLIQRWIMQRLRVSSERAFSVWCPPYPGPDPSPYPAHPARSPLQLQCPLPDPAHPDPDLHPG